MLEQEFARYEAFVDAGKHGEMAYLANAREARRRLDTDAILEGAESIVCVAESYAGGDREPPSEGDQGVARNIAHYARGSDYHNHLRRRLRRLAAFIRTLGENVRARPICDDAPVLERAWAQRAGLGFVGKNGLIITPGLGSLSLARRGGDDSPAHGRGAYRRALWQLHLCLDACPTAAFDAPIRARSAPMYLVSHHRASRSDARRAASGGRGASLRVRRLPGRMPL